VLIRSHSEGRVCVAELNGDNLRVGTGEQRERRGRMAEIVQADFRDARFLAERRPPSPIEVAMPNNRSCGRRENGIACRREAFGDGNATFASEEPSRSRESARRFGDRRRS
jgi:hypothetical protein